MEVAAAFRLFKILNSPEGRQVRDAIKNGNDGFLNIFLKSVGVANPTPADISELTEAVGGFKEPKQHSSAYNKKKQYEAAKEMAGRIRNVMVDSPGKLALKFGAAALGEGLDAAGDIAINNGNRLAQAILAARRSGTDEHDAIYGKNAHDRVTDAWAQNRIRKGENLGRGLKAAGNVTKQALGMYNMQDQISKGMEAGQYMQGVPGQIYEMINGMNRHSQKLGL
jgi:hypothetical protein